MKIALSSQNGLSITGQPARCSTFLIFDTDAGVILDSQVLELPDELMLQHIGNDDPHPLDEMDVLICGALGQGFVNKMAERGLKAVATTLTDPDEAVNAYLAGNLPEKAPRQKKAK